MTRLSIHDQLRAAFEGAGLSLWELARRANVRQSLLEKLVGDSGRAQMEVLERVAGALDLDVCIAPSSPAPHRIGPVLSAVDAAVMHFTPEREVTMATQTATVLALDLEATLISNAVSVFPRTGLHRFLTCCRGLFERIVMFTTIPETRFRQIANLLVDEGAAPAWFASIEYVTWSGPTKDLRFVLGADPTQVLLVDDMELYVHADQRACWVRIEGFEPPFVQADGELDRVLEELTRRVCREP